MKYMFFIISLLSVVGCDIADFVWKQPEEACKNEPIHLNICVLGNSYSNDSFSYVPFILQEYGITCKIHIYYRGSCTLQDLDIQWEDDAPYGILHTNGTEHIRLHFSIDTRTQSSWSNDIRLSSKDVVKLEKWDIISVQQGGKSAKYLDRYEPYLTNVMSRIDSICKYDYKLAWFMAYNGPIDTEDELSLITQKRIVETYPFDLIFPVATAVFSAQTSEVFQQLGDSDYKNMYYEDNVHLQEGLPCYLAALTISQSILDIYKPGQTVLGNKVRPTKEWILSINGITPNGESVGVTNANCNLAQQIAIMANLKKFSITNVD